MSGAGRLKRKRKVSCDSAVLEVSLTTCLVWFKNTSTGAEEEEEVADEEEEDEALAAASPSPLAADLCAAFWAPAPRSTGAAGLRRPNTWLTTKITTRPTSAPRITCPLVNPSLATTGISLDMERRKQRRKRPNNDLFFSTAFFGLLLKCRREHALKAQSRITSTVALKDPFLSPKIT